MRTGHHRISATLGFALSLVSGLACSLALATLAGADAWAQSTTAQGAAALSGQVSSAEESAMEGVVVSAKRAGGTITVSVVSDAEGKFAFPAARLAPGHYALQARAAGYELDGAAAADVSAGAEAKADLHLRKAADLAGQLTNAEWLVSMPGSEPQKKFLLNCIGCHTLERIVKSKYDAEGFLQVFKRMAGYYPGSTPEHPQRLHGDFLRERGGELRGMAEWLAGVNLSRQESWDWPLKTLPRLSGKSTRVIITEYDLPDRAIQPHDVVLDGRGNVWYSDFGRMFLGKMDPATGQVTQYPVPETKPGFPVGSLDLEVDHDGNPWLGVMYQASIARFDAKTQTFQTWSIPKDWDSDGAQFGHLAVEGTPVDGKVWIKNSNGTLIYRLDPASGQFENLGAPQDPRTGKKIGTYGLHSDAQNNVYLLDYAAGNIVRIDARTKQTTVYLTPTPNSHPRRGRVDAEGRLWFAEYFGDAIGMLDAKTGVIKEWKVPTPWSAPYDAAAGRDEAWTGSMVTDRVSRLDLKSGQYTEYPLPRPTNIRRVYVDTRTSPGTLWVGSNHGASIVKVEPLE